MKQIKASVLLFGSVILFAVFCAGILIGRGTSSDEFRIVTERPVMQSTTLPPAAKPTEAPTTKPTEAITSEPTTEADPFPININTAEAEDLMRLPKIGPTLAQRIIDYRENYGPFETTKELDMVEGIGDKILEEIMQLVTVEE